MRKTKKSITFSRGFSPILEDNGFRPVRIFEEVRNETFFEPSFFAGGWFMGVPFPAPKEVIEFLFGERFSSMGIEALVHLFQWDFVFFFHKP